MLIARVVPDLPLNVPRSTSVTSMDDRVSASKAKARRQWVARTALMLGATGVLLAIMVVWRRDTDTIAAKNRATDRSTQAIQAYIQQTGLLPAVLPPDERNTLGYGSYADRYYAQNGSDPVIMAWSSPVSLLLRSDGRSVIVYERGKVRTEWMTEAQFSAAWSAQTRREQEFERQRRAEVPQLP